MPYQSQGAQSERRRMDLIAVILIILGALALVYVAFDVHPLLGTATLGCAFVGSGLVLGTSKS